MLNSAVPRLVPDRRWRVGTAVAVSQLIDILIKHL